MLGPYGIGQVTAVPGVESLVMTDECGTSAAGGYSSVSYRRPSTGTPVSLVAPVPLPRAPQRWNQRHTDGARSCARARPSAAR